MYEMGTIMANTDLRDHIQLSRTLRVSVDSETAAVESGRRYLRRYLVHLHGLLLTQLSCTTEQFVDHYYNTFDTSRGALAPLYVRQLIAWPILTC